MNFIVQNQPQQILLCFSFGYLSGFLVFPISAIGLIISSSKMKDIHYFFEFLACATLFVFLKNAYSLGEFRAYMGIVFLLGFYIYKKTLGKSIAKLFKKLYNNFCKRFTLWRNNHNDRRKSKKNTSGNNLNRRNTAIYFGVDNDLPNGRNKGKASANRTTKGRNSNSSTAKRANAR